MPKTKENQKSTTKKWRVPTAKKAASKSASKPAAGNAKSKKAASVKKVTEKTKTQKKISKAPKPTLRIFSLGGLNEIGKNITVLECGNDIIVVDCGIGFPDDDMLGVDLVIPNFSYLESNVDKIRGVFITHGHEDHIGSLPYFLRSMNVPVY